MKSQTGDLISLIDRRTALETHAVPTLRDLFTFAAKERPGLAKPMTKMAQSLSTLAAAYRAGDEEAADKARWKFRAAVEAANRIDRITTGNQINTARRLVGAFAPRLDPSLN